MKGTESSSVSDDEYVILLCTDPDRIETDTGNGEIILSTRDILTWDFPTILNFQTIKVQAHRNRWHAAFTFSLFLSILREYIGQLFKITAVLLHLFFSVSLVECISVYNVNSSCICFILRATATGSLSDPLISGDFSVVASGASQLCFCFHFDCK